MKRFFLFVIQPVSRYEQPILIQPFFLIELKFFFFFIIMIVVGSMSGEKSVDVKKNSVLTINLKTSIIDSPTEEEQSIFNIKNKHSQYKLEMFLSGL